MTNEKTNNRLILFIAQAEAVLVKMGLLLTPKRKIILHELACCEACFEVEALYIKMRSRNVPVCRATLNNLISTLLKCGVIVTVSYQPKKPKLLRLALTEVVDSTLLLTN
jgi:Fe2+ or Zn2+ uptake regulation protein